MIKIALGSDHAGWKVKEKAKSYLKPKYAVKDFGTDSEESVDYSDFGVKVARAVASGKFQYGILICGSGLGMCIVANKIKGVRAANCYDKTTAELARRHNDANILCLGARLLDIREIKSIIKIFLSAPFEEGRHQRRVDKIKQLDKA